MDKCVEKVEEEIDSLIVDYPLAPKILSEWKSMSTE
jgi:hypothetical protein